MSSTIIKPAEYGTNQDNKVLISLIKIVASLILLGALGYGGYQLYLFFKGKLDKQDSGNKNETTTTSADNGGGGGGGGGDGNGTGGGNNGDDGDSAPKASVGAIVAFSLTSIFLLLVLYYTIRGWGKTAGLERLTYGATGAFFKVAPKKILGKRSNPTVIYQEMVKAAKELKRVTKRAEKLDPSSKLYSELKTKRETLALKIEKYDLFLKDNLAYPEAAKKYSAKFDTGPGKDAVL